MATLEAQHKPAFSVGISDYFMLNEYLARKYRRGVATCMYF